MMKTAFLLVLALGISSCAFKQDEAGSSPQRAVSKYEGFRPNELRIKKADKTYVLIDMIELPPGDYQLDATKVPVGTIEYVYQYPVFADAQCQGLGYSISYEPRRRTVTNLLKLVTFRNQKKVDLDHLVVAPTESVQVAVYAEQGPISEYVDLEKLPSEFVKTFQPSNRCHQMCGMARVKPARKPIFEAGRIDCAFWLLGTDDRHFPVTTFTDDVAFNPSWIEQAQMRDAHLKRLQDCNAVVTNDDLKNYYQQASNGDCAYQSQRSMLREWYFVEQKIPYRDPVYSIQNFAQIAHSTSETQSDGITERLVHPITYWQN